MSSRESASNTGDVHTPERRKHARQSLRSLSYIQLDEANGGFLLNLSEGGLAVQAAMSVVEDSFSRVKLQIAQSRSWVETPARVAWADDQRRTLGLEFIDLPETTRKQIGEWLASEAAAAALPVLDDEEIAEKPQEARLEAQKTEHNAAAPSADDIPITLLPPTPPGVPHEVHTKAEPVSQGAVSSTPEKTAPVRPASAPAEKKRASIVQTTARTGIPGAVLSQEHSKPGFGNRYAPLMIILAALSLAAGWEAGRSNLLQAAAEIVGTSGAPASSTVSAAAADRVIVASFDVIDSNNQSWTVPFAGPTSAPEGKSVAAKPVETQAAATPAGEPRIASKTASMRLWTLSAPTSSRRAARSSVPADAPQLSVSQNASSFALPSSIATLAQPLARPSDTSVTQAALVHRVDPVYPISAYRQGVTGTVKLQARVGVDGVVTNVKTISGSPLLTPAAVLAFQQWRYQPAVLDGHAVPSDVTVAIVFTLPQQPQ